MATVTPVAGASSIVSVGGTPVVAIAGNANGVNGYIQNPASAADQGLGAAEDLIVNPVSSAASPAVAGGINGTNFRIPPGGIWQVIPGQTTPTSVNAATSGHKFSAVTWLVAAFVLLASLLGADLTQAQPIDGPGPQPVPSPWIVTAPYVTLPPGLVVQPLASTTATAGLNVPQGVAPTSPINGDVWTTPSGIFARVNGVTYKLSAGIGTPCNIVADGVTDNSATIAACITAANSTGNTAIVFPAGIALAPTLSATISGQQVWLVCLSGPGTCVLKTNTNPSLTWTGAYGGTFNMGFDNGGAANNSTLSINSFATQFINSYLGNGIGNFATMASSGASTVTFNGSFGTPNCGAAVSLFAASAGAGLIVDNSQLAGSCPSPTAGRSFISAESGTFDTIIARNNTVQFFDYPIKVTAGNGTVIQDFFLSGNVWDAMLHGYSFTANGTGVIASINLQDKWIGAASAGANCLSLLGTGQILGVMATPKFGGCGASGIVASVTTLKGATFDHIEMDGLNIANGATADAINLAGGAGYSYISITNSKGGYTGVSSSFQPKNGITIGAAIDHLTVIGNDFQGSVTNYNGMLAGTATTFAHTNSQQRSNIGLADAPGYFIASASATLGNWQTPTGAGQASLGAATDNGAIIGGRGSVADLSFANKNGVIYCQNGTGTTTLTCTSLALTNPLAGSNGGTGCSVASGICLDNITGFAATGILARTGAATYAFRTLIGPAAGIAVTNGDGVSGNPTLALANDLAALEALAGTGIAVRTAADTWAQRSIATASSARITVSNGDGVAGNPTLDLATTAVTAASYGGQGKFTSFTVDAFGRLTAASDGTLTTINGVTYPASYNSGAIPYASGTGTIASSAALGANCIVYGGGAGIAPATSTSTCPTVSSAGIVVVPNTTNATSTTTGAVQISGGLGVALDIWGRVITGKSDQTFNSQGQINAVGATDPNKQVWFGFDTTVNRGFLQSIRQGTGVVDMMLQPNGGNVYIGGNSGAVSGDMLSVNGQVGAIGILRSASGRLKQVRVITAAGAVTVATTDHVICVNKTSGAATTVNLFGSPTTGSEIEVKDCKGDAATNNITVTPAAGNVDGSATFVINSNFGRWRGIYNGTFWQTEGTWLLWRDIRHDNDNRPAWSYSMVG